MAGRVEGKVAFITGVARGQGRAHALRLAQEGADIIGIDICKQIDSVDIALSTPDDLAETIRLVEATGRRIHAVEGDVRDQAALQAVVDEGVRRFGRLDIVVANAGVTSSGAPLDSLDEQEWRDIVDVNLTGAWLTTKVAIPHIIAGGRGGSIVLTSSVGGLRAYGNIGHYVTAKHGVVGLMRTLALELGQHRIRVNSVHPTQANTPIAINDAIFRLFRPDLENPTVDDFAVAAQSMHLLPTPWVEPEDVANAVLFLASDEGRFITGVTLPIDAGALQK